MSNNSLAAGSIPNGLELDLAIDVHLFVAGTEILTDGKPQSAAFVSSTAPTGHLVIKYVNGTPTNPTGLYINGGSLEQRALFAVPFSVVRDRVAKGGTLSIYVDPPSTVTPPPGAQVFKNGIPVTGNVQAGSGVWATFAPAA